MKSVLVIVHSLSADRSKAAGRLTDYIGTLRDYGWEPIVLTHRRTGGTASEQLQKLPPDIDIIPTGSISTSGLPKFIKTLSSLVTGLLHDRQALWEFLTQRKAVRIFKNEGADLIYTVYPPYSSHLIGLRLKKKYPGLPWVADLSATDNPLKSYEKKFSALIYENADLVIEGEPEMQAQELSELFEKACRAQAARKLVNT